MPHNIYDMGIILPQYTEGKILPLQLPFFKINKKGQILYIVNFHKGNEIQFPLYDYSGQSAHGLERGLGALNCDPGVSEFRNNHLLIIQSGDKILSSELALISKSKWGWFTHNILRQI